MEKSDPLVQKITEEANLDYEYAEMLNYIEGDTYFSDIDTNCELKMMKDDLPHMSVITLDSGNRVIVKNESEILIPKSLGKQMMDILHFSHAAGQSMYTQCKGNIFWHNMRRSFKRNMRSVIHVRNTKQLKLPHIMRSVGRTSSPTSSPANASKWITVKKDHKST